MAKYVIIREVGADGFTREFDNKDEAIREARREWESLSDGDKKRTSSFYVLESVDPDEESERHFDGDYIAMWKNNGSDKVYYLFEKNAHGGNNYTKYSLDDLKAMFEPGEEFEDTMQYKAWEWINSIEDMQEYIDEYINDNGGVHYHDYIIEF